MAQNRFWRIMGALPWLAAGAVVAVIVLYYAGKGTGWWG
jgi:hypothetical protein